MAKAKELQNVMLSSVPVEACILHWPLSVVRLKGQDPKDLIKVSDAILKKWKNYEDIEAMILSHSEGEEHNTVTLLIKS